MDEELNSSLKAKLAGASERPWNAHTRKERMVELIHQKDAKGHTLKGWFLGFGHNGLVGTAGDTYTQTCAIIELAGGHVELVDLSSIRFLT